MHPKRRDRDPFAVDSEPLALVKPLKKVGRRIYLQLSLYPKRAGDLSDRNACDVVDGLRRALHYGRIVTCTNKVARCGLSQTGRKECGFTGRMLSQG